MALTRNKIATVEEARRWRAHQQGVVVFTNGVFDLLHPGHVELLEQARVQGDALVVGVNSDRSVQQLEKGKGRPIMDAPSRMRMLAALAAVDLVVGFEEPTPLELIRLLQPDILCKGADYTEADVVGADEVKRAGGRVLILPLLEGFSTTRIVERICAT